MVSEAFLAWVWEVGAAGRVLTGQDGASLEVIYAGRRGFGRGPDFRGALVAFGGTRLLSGDVEVHVHSRDWARHGHADDRSYSETLIHVVWAAGGSSPPSLPNGTLLLEVALEPQLRGRVGRLQAQFSSSAGLRRASSGQISPTALGRLTEAAGLERFLEKAAVFEADIAALGPDESFYRAFMRALGYTANQAAFLSLAEALPVQEARALALSGGASAVEAALLSRAGLGPGPDQAPTPRQQPFLPTRPGNAPCRRLAAAAILVESWAASGPRACLEAALRAGSAPAASRMADALRVASPTSYWADHHAPGRPLSRPSPWLLGYARATDIVANVSLPFLYAVGQNEQRPRLSQAALDAYLREPSASTNHIVEEARRLLARGAAWRPGRVCQQQGLILLSRRYLRAPSAWRLHRGGWSWRPDLVFEPSSQPPVGDRRCVSRPRRAALAG